MMAEKLLIVLFSLAIASLANATLLSEQDRCYPLFNPRPNCNSEQAEGWIYWNSMNYKYFAKRRSQGDATEACRPWDEDICNQENGWMSWLVSYLVDGELEKAILPAFGDACFTSGDLFWIGAIYKDNEQLVYRDSNSQSSSLNTFDQGKIPSLNKGADCVAMNGRNGQMVVRPCSERLPYMCKIMPIGTSH